MIVLEAAGVRAEIDPQLGGRLASLVVNGRERLLQRPANVPIELALRSGCYVMAPWIGRIEHGIVDWNGRHVQLERNAGVHAIHGVVFATQWATLEAGSSCAVLACSLDTSRWPFAARMTQRYTLDGAGLSVEAELVAGECMPAAIGWHPWFVREPGMQIAVESGQTLELSPDLIPTGGLTPVDSRTDLRGGASIDGRTLDDVYLSVSAPLTVRWADLQLDIALDAPVSTAVVFIAPEAVCVEPATACPDAIRLSAGGMRATGLATLEAGERLAARTRWSWRPT